MPAVVVFVVLGFVGAVVWLVRGLVMLLGAIVALVAGVVVVLGSVWLMMLGTIAFVLLGFSLVAMQGEWAFWRVQQRGEATVLAITCQTTLQQTPLGQRPSPQDHGMRMPCAEADALIAARPDLRSVKQWTTVSARVSFRPADGRAPFEVEGPAGNWGLTDASKPGELIELAYDPSAPRRLRLPITAFNYLLGVVGLVLLGIAAALFGPAATHAPRRRGPSLADLLNRPAD